MEALRLKKVLLLVLGLCLLFTSVSRAQNKPAFALKVGDTGFTFSLPNANPAFADTVSLEEYRFQKGVILVFMTNGCYSCILSKDRIKALHTKFAGQGYPVIAINPSNPKIEPEETFVEMQKLIKKDGFNFPYLQDASQQVSRQYNITYTPEVCVLKRENNLWVVKYIGPIDNDLKLNNKHRINYVENVLNALIKGKELPSYP
ncbi:MAG TPA: redoxin domain-containing protein [Daejeonella sp.]|nr:redoxin domain-containing protein [Daejeonella sp.]